MARYIDADKFKNNLEKAMEKMHLIGGVKGVDVGAVIVALDRQPTADVVPKSEAEKIIGKFECFLCHATGGRLSKHTYDLRTMETVATDCINETYNDGYGEGYKDCAREIFAEIEEVFRLHTEGGYYLNGAWFPQRLDLDTGDAIAELKKKYTEGEE